MKETEDTITNLVTDFQDGVKLIQLVEALTGKKVARYNRNPRFRSQKIDNINVAIKTLENEWGLFAVGVDPSGMYEYAGFCAVRRLIGLCTRFCVLLGISQNRPRDA